jgi:hypothetical protein
MLTMLGEPLQNGPYAHDDRTQHDRPPPSEALVEPRSNGDSENGTELVAGRHEAEESGLDVPFAFGIFETIAKVYDR